MRETALTTFSQRHGYKVRDALQVESVDPALRTVLWNALEEHYWSTVRFVEYSSGIEWLLQDNPEMDRLCRALYTDLLKWPLDRLNDDFGVLREKLREYFLKDATWNEVYDFIEFVARAYPDTERNGRFRKHCNALLEREASGYRFVGGDITPIIDPVEISAVEEGLKVKHPPAVAHLATALARLSDRANPDYRNSVKESISAVEAICQKVSGNPSATLGGVLAALEKQQTLHPALKKAFSALYGYTSDSGGIRHALIEGDREVTFHEAKFMLVACSAFVNYVLGESAL